MVKETVAGLKALLHGWRKGGGSWAEVGGFGRVLAYALVTVLVPERTLTSATNDSTNPRRWA